ncbi:MAG: hypothetical protein U1F76_30730 [Candidatus Competibacteraceae bacterium]
MKRHHKSLPIVRVDLFPFLSVVLCVIGVQAILLLTLSSIQPLLERRAAVVQSYNTAEIYHGVITERIWKIPQSDVEIISPIMDGEIDDPGLAEKWKVALEKLCKTLAVRTTGIVHEQKRQVIEVAFKETAIPGLRFTLKILDDLRQQLRILDGSPAFTIYYRLLEH